ncbi:hypothetical protein IU443_28175 [Nocardia farcinica]|uniref:hypothetical protein n=1 Tax=Nocardia farcinica TaxID=37329 RepID=UPI001892FEF9|nr:hypothetical protein [Nocardia farcinica]MBF6393809.1 hypothetical protein [Nocardia farcinica]MBF6411269.1 hypothetical protein [Nocardia farcinica]MCZ9330244.1 hypothetical protein [Nocardia farcinica]UEX26222.1 hypothetical protein LMJ57_30185 [Nocardia farcinica]
MGDRDSVEYSTRAGASSARWIVRGSVVHVLAMVDEHGRVIDMQDRPLGECFNDMPRALWEKVRQQFEIQRDPDFAAVLHQTRERLKAASRAARIRRHLS